MWTERHEIRPKSEYGCEHAYDSRTPGTPRSLLGPQRKRARSMAPPCGSPHYRFKRCAGISARVERRGGSGTDGSVAPPRQARRPVPGPAAGRGESKTDGSISFTSVKYIRQSVLRPWREYSSCVLVESRVTRNFVHRMQPEQDNTTYNSNFILCYWTKARPTADDQVRYHLLPFPCPDVVSVGNQQTVLNR
jgi:hypothetical protein